MSCRHQHKPRQNDNNHTTIVLHTCTSTLTWAGARNKQSTGNTETTQEKSQPQYRSPFSFPGTGLNDVKRSNQSATEFQQSILYHLQGGSFCVGGSAPRAERAGGTIVDAPRRETKWPSFIQSTEQRSSSSSSSMCLSQSWSLLILLSHSIWTFSGPSTCRNIGFTDPKPAGRSRHCTGTTTPLPGWTPFTCVCVYMFKSPLMFPATDTQVHLLTLTLGWSRGFCRSS